MIRNVLAALSRWPQDGRAYIAVALLALCAALPGVDRMPVMDVDEARFVQASRQMLETGDFVRIRVQERERNRKPAGVHWLQAASAAAFEPIAGRNNAIWAYRLPSVLGALLAALATLWAGRALLRPEAALIGASLLAAGLLFGFEGMTAKTDALMLGFTTLAIAALARLRHAQPARPRVIALLFWSALACAVMIKGPVPLMIAAATLAALALWDRRKAGWMAPLGWWAGPALALLIVLPWGLAIGFATEWRFYTAAFSADLAPKLAGEDHAHAGFFGYHLALMPLLMFPAAFALPAAARLFFVKQRSEQESGALAFLVTWAGPALLMFELSPAKLIHYAMPVYPAVALLCAAGFVAAIERGWRLTLAAGFALFCLTGLALAGAVGFALHELQGEWTRPVLAAALCAMLIGAGAAGLALLRQAGARAAATVACALCMSFVLRGVVLPQASGLRVSTDAAAAAQQADARRALWVIGYDEPSIVFLTRTSARLVNAQAAAVGAQAGDFVVVEAADLDTLRGGLAQRRLTLAPRGAPVEGISLSSNARVRLIAAEVTPANGALAARLR